MQKNLSINSNSKFGTRQITTIGMLSAISIVLGITRLGFIQIQPVNATIMHVPVIIGAVIEGPVVGALIGLIFGIFSMIQAITTPTPTSFLFFNPIVAIVPRVLIGITSYYTYKFLFVKNKSVKIGAAAIVGSLTNTVGVLGFIYIFYVNELAKVLKLSAANVVRAVIVAPACINAPAEAALSVLITIPVALTVMKIRKKQ